MLPPAKKLTTFVEGATADISHPPSPLIRNILAELDRLAETVTGGA
jgi:hypothetical protein